MIQNINIKIIFFVLLISGITLNFSYAQLNKKQKKVFSRFQPIDSAKLLNCLFNGNAIEDEYFNPNFKVDTFIHNQVAVIIGSTSIKHHRIKYKSTYGRYRSFTEDEIRYDSLISSTLTLDSFNFDFNLLSLQPQNYNEGVNIPPMCFWESKSEIRFSNRKGNKYLLLKGDRVGCNSRLCGGFYFLVIDLNQNKPKIYIVDYPAIFPFTFRNLILNRNMLNGELKTYYYLVDYEKEPTLKVAIQSLVFRNNQSIIDTIEKPLINSYSYNMWVKRPKLLVNGICK